MIYNMELVAGKMTETNLFQILLSEITNLVTPDLLC